MRFSGVTAVLLAPKLTQEDLICEKKGKAKTTVEMT